MALPSNVILGFKSIPLMIRAAKERRTLTYGEIGEAIDHPPHFLGKALAYVRDNICETHRLPPLTVLVVDSVTGLPGDSFFPDGRDDLSDEEYRAIVADLQATVYDYPKWDDTWANLKRHYGFDEK